MNILKKENFYDVIIIGAGVSGPTIAEQLTKKSLRVLMLEAGQSFKTHGYPRREIDANSQLYWAGGIELNTSASIGFLRPKVVGGGTVVNQALLDRFDDMAFDSWKEQSGISYFSKTSMAPYYDEAESGTHIQEIPQEWRNGNAKIFEEGFKLNNYKCAPLVRGQKDCKYEEGYHCINCLSGCSIDSKQSSPVTTLKRALENGLELKSKSEVLKLKEKNGIITIWATNEHNELVTYQAGKVVLAAGAIGNTKLLLQSEYQKKLPMLGKNFYTHPQSMVLGTYQQKINAHLGPLQSLKSADENFRVNSFKLENVFAPPVAISMLLAGVGKKHYRLMKEITHMACVEVAIRDTNPGEIALGKNGKLIIKKELDKKDKATRKKGLKAIYNILKSTGAKEIIPGEFDIGLHLMGGLGIGTSANKSVVNPEFNLHNSKNIFSADSSIFPNAPGINPSLTIMALSRKASREILRSFV